MMSVDVRDSAQIYWWQPDIKEGKDWLSVKLLHVRASDAFFLRFDSGRNGFVVVMVVSPEGDDRLLSDPPEYREVAFIPAEIADGDKDNYPLADKTPD